MRGESAARYTSDWPCQAIRARTIPQSISRLFEQADIPYAPLHDLDSLIDDPHLTAVGLLQSIDHPTEGTLRLAGPAATWSKTPPSIRQYPPRLGEHSAAILREAGFSALEIETLIADGAMVDADPVDKSSTA